MNKLGIVIPNYERKLDKIVSAVQNYDWILFCIVDDHSSPEVNKHNYELFKNFNNVVYMHSDSNEGPGVERLLGVNIINKNCEYIAFLDSDDELVNEGIEFVRTSELTADIYGFKSIWKGEFYRSTPDVNDVNCELFNKVMRSDFLVKALNNYKGYSPRYGEDIELTYLIKSSCKTWIQVDKIFSKSNISKVGITNNIYHNFDLLKKTVNDLFMSSQAAIDNDILSNRYLLAAELIISGYRRHHEEYKYELSDKY